MYTHCVDNKVHLLCTRTRSYITCHHARMPSELNLATLYCQLLPARLQHISLKRYIFLVPSGVGRYQRSHFYERLPINALPPLAKIAHVTAHTYRRDRDVISTYVIDSAIDAT